MVEIRTVQTVTGICVAAVAALTVAGCGGTSGTVPGNRWVGPSVTTGVTPVDAPVRLTRITSACALLPTETVVRVLGAGEGTRLTAQEEPVQDSGTSPKHSCRYGSDGREALSLVTSTLANQADTVSATLDRIADNSGATTRPVRGVGAGAVTYVSDGVRVLAVTVPHGDDLRLFILSGPSVIPQAKLTELARHVAPQL
ncbi:hypothetical protein [Micromonospora echinofusca]|uniref:DUF5642 domain-containing protein n=1 Tax=Micromonospora echinofusca TaxID=47858 RepID=A0ABS3VX65_MICEH|nr:hypothetical protein [Micromonospora echinofusca]MBO4209100.1 hypothetical protein [Micromonospora echinofusca]